MGTWRVFLAAFLAALPILVVNATPAYACSCLARTLEDEVKGADLIVLGTTVRVRDGVRTSSGIQFDAVVTTIAVDGYLKGSGPSTLEHATYPRNAAACQYFTEIGDRNLLLLRSFGDGSYDTSTCVGNLRITSDNEESVTARINEIGQILHPGTDVADLPAPAPPLDTGSGEFLPGVLLGAAAFGALLAGGALFFARRPG